MLYHECPPHLSPRYFDRANNIQMRITTSGMCDRQDKAGRGGKDTIAIQHTYLPLGSTIFVIGTSAS